MAWKLKYQYWQLFFLIKLFPISRRLALCEHFFYINKLIVNVTAKHSIIEKQSGEQNVFIFKWSVQIETQNNSKSPGIQGFWNLEGRLSWNWISKILRSDSRNEQCLQLAPGIQNSSLQGHILVPSSKNGCDRRLFSLLALSNLLPLSLTASNLQ